MDIFLSAVKVLDRLNPHLLFFFKTQEFYCSSIFIFFMFFIFHIICLIIFFSLFQVLQILPIYSCTFSLPLHPFPSQKQNKQKTKTPKAKNKTYACVHAHTKQSIESNWCWSAVVEYEARPGVWLSYLLSLHWGKLIFPLPACRLQVAFWSVVTLCAHISFSVLEFCLA